MKASRDNHADIVAYGVAVVGLVSLNFLGFDLLLSEPFGSLMVFTRAVFSLGLLAAMYQALRLRTNLQRQAVRVRT